MLIFNFRIYRVELEINSFKPSTMKIQIRIIAPHVLYFALQGCKF